MNDKDLRIIQFTYFSKLISGIMTTLVARGVLKAEDFEFIMKEASKELEVGNINKEK